MKLRNNQSIGFTAGSLRLISRVLVVSFSLNLVLSNLLQAQAAPAGGTSIMTLTPTASANRAAMQGKMSKQVAYFTQNATSDTISSIVTGAGGAIWTALQSITAPTPILVAPTAVLDPNSTGGTDPMKYYSELVTPITPTCDILLGNNSFCFGISNYNCGGSGQSACCVAPNCIDNQNLDLMAGMLYFGGAAGRVPSMYAPNFTTETDKTVWNAFYNPTPTDVVQQAIIANYNSKASDYPALTANTGATEYTLSLEGSGTGLLRKTPKLCAALDQLLLTPADLVAGKTAWAGATCRKDEDCCYDNNTNPTMQLSCIKSSAMAYQAMVPVPSAQGTTLVPGGIVQYGICDTPQPSCQGVPGQPADPQAGCCTTLVHDLSNNNCVLPSYNSPHSSACVQQSDCTNNYICDRASGLNMCIYHCSGLQEACAAVPFKPIYSNSLAGTAGCKVDKDCAANYQCLPSKNSNGTPVLDSSGAPVLRCIFNCNSAPATNPNSVCLSTNVCDSSSEKCIESLTAGGILDSPCMTSADCLFNADSFTYLVCDMVNGVGKCKGAQRNACSTDSDCAHGPGPGLDGQLNSQLLCIDKVCKSSCTTVNTDGTCTVAPCKVDSQETCGPEASSGCCLHEGYETCGIANTGPGDGRVCCMPVGTDYACTSDADCCYSVNGSYCDSKTDADNPRCRNTDGTVPGGFKTSTIVLGSVVGVLLALAIGAYVIVTRNRRAALVKAEAAAAADKQFQDMLDRGEIMVVSTELLAETNRQLAAYKAIVDRQLTPGAALSQAEIVALAGDLGVPEVLAGRTFATLQQAAPVGKLAAVLDTVTMQFGRVTSAISRGVDAVFGAGGPPGGQPLAAAQIAEVDAAIAAVRQNADDAAAHIIEPAGTAAAVTHAVPVPERVTALPAKLDVTLAQSRRAILITAFQTEMRGLGTTINDISEIESHNFAELLLIDSALKGKADSFGGVMDGPALHDLALEIGQPTFSKAAIDAFDPASKSNSTTDPEGYVARTSRVRADILTNSQLNRGVSLSSAEMKQLSVSMNTLLDLQMQICEDNGDFVVTREQLAGGLRDVMGNLRTKDGRNYITPMGENDPAPGTPIDPDLPMTVGDPAARV